MTGQKTRIIRRFEREGRIKLKKGNLGNNFLNAMMFSLQEIKEIIGRPYDADEPLAYKCGHKGKPVILDDNILSMTTFFEWCESVGWKGDSSQCWECWCKESSSKVESEAGK